MFTGIVEAVGEVQAVEDEAGGRRLRIGAPFADLSAGESISVDGACLTVEDHDPGESFSVFLAAETLERTTLEAVEAGDGVNLERAMPADGRFDGHVVQGHVDATTEVTDVERVGEDWWYTFALPERVGQYVVEKGSIALDGISLTVAALDDEAGEFSVAIVPTTYRETTVSDRAAGDRVNVEVDVFAKYVERMLATGDRETAPDWLDERVGGRTR